MGVAPVVELVDDVELFAVVRQRGEHRVTGLDHDRLGDAEGPPRLFLFEDTRLEDRVDERRGRAVTAGQLGTVDLDQRVVDLEPGQRRHAVLDRLDRRVGVDQGRASGSPRHVLHTRWNLHGRRDVGALEHDAVVGRRRQHRHGGLLAQQQALARHHHRSRQRLLMAAAGPLLDRSGIIDCLDHGQHVF